ncbi:MAG: ROK family transcriptional regulator [Clostridiaceae bacterium]|nr:ROK family transcriptional regulator [Clostridiaceae bacterium]
MAPKRQIVNQHLSRIRYDNMRRVVRAIMHDGPVSRAELAKMTGLSPTAVAHFVNLLEQDGWLNAEVEGLSSGGRKPNLLSINRKARHVLCIQVTQHRVAGLIYNLEPETVYRCEKTADAAGDAILTAVFAVADDLTAYAGQHKLNVLALGVSLPGVVNAEAGRLVYAADLEWQNIRLKDILEQRYSIAVYLQNDANLAALAEKAYGIARNESAMIYIKDLGGAGILVNNELYQGHGGAAGEIGHISIDRHGERCKCGNYGCLYQYVSRAAIEAAAIKGIKQGVATRLARPGDSDFSHITVAAVLAAAQAGDRLACDIIADVAVNLGTALVTLVNMMDIRFIVIGGAFAEAPDFFYTQIMDVFKERTAKISFEDIRIERAFLLRDADLLGCVCLVLEETFKKPIL